MLKTTRRAIGGADATPPPITIAERTASAEDGNAAHVADVRGIDEATVTVAVAENETNGFGNEPTT